MNKKVVILRGISGSGKSSFVQKHLSSAIVCSADTYFARSGIYQFKREELSTAHEECMRRFLTATSKEGLGRTVVVDNTNIRLLELSPYVAVARARGYEVDIIRFATDPAVAIARNVHKVPAETVLRMDRELETVPHYMGRERVIIG